MATNAYYGHLETDAPFDERPLASFSADATPAIVDALPGLSAEAQRTVRAKLNRRFGPQSNADSDWRTLNRSREQAREAVAGLQ